MSTETTTTEPGQSTPSSGEANPNKASLPTPGVRGIIPGALLLVGAVLAFGAGLWLSPAVRGKDSSSSVSSNAAASSTSKQLWTCGMHPQVIQDHPGDCPICHMKLTPLKTDVHGQSDTGMERKVLYWRDPELPGFTSAEPGKSPAGRELVPTYLDEISGGPAVTVDPVIVQNMGVRVAPATRGSLSRSARLVGYVVEREPDHRDINLRVGGWIEKLYANIDGMLIEKGAPLFDLYSPEITVAIDELISARRSADGAGKESDARAGRVANTLYEAARRKLELWGLTTAQVEQLAKEEKAPRTVSILAPIGGHLTAKMVYEGAAVQSGMLALRLANRDMMWVEARAFEQQLPLVTVGAPATATVVAQPGRVYEGKVAFIHPHLDPGTRTALVRVEVPNNDHALREGMYATVEIKAPASDQALLIPREAVLDTGDRQIVFVSESSGHFSPRKVTTGLEGSEGLVQVLSGLAPGESVVTSGQFLLDSESRLKEAIQKHLSGGLATHQGHGGKKPAPEHEGHTEAEMPASKEGALTVPHSDEVIGAYLNLSKALGAPSESADPLSVEDLLTVSKKAVSHANGEAKELLHKVVATGEALQGKSSPEQRALFQHLSNAVIELAKKTGVSTSLGSEVVVAHCPMALNNNGASWLQVGRQIANPYYGSSMKRCGTVEDKIAVRTE